MIFPCPRIAVLLRLAIPLGVGGCLLTGPAWSYEGLQSREKAPEGQTFLKYAFGGVFFVDKNLNDEYGRLLLRIHALKSDFEGGRIGTAKSLTRSFRVSGNRFFGISLGGRGSMSRRRSGWYGLGCSVERIPISLMCG